MKSISMILFFQLCCLVSFSQINSLTVSGTANIFGSGKSTTPSPGGGGGGTIPPYICLIKDTGYFYFTNITGNVSCCVGELNDPDGATLSSTDINSYDGISGIILNGKKMFLTGVFLNDSIPINPAPPILNFTSNTNFTSLSPQLNQTFFIGDGKDDSGNLQKFIIPNGSTRLFLGFADALLFGGFPGYYGDNSENLIVSYDAGGLSSNITIKDTSICQGESIILNAENNGANYSWSTGDSIQYIYVGNSGTYNVTVTSIGSCSFTSSATVIVKETHTDTLQLEICEGSNFENYNEAGVYIDSYIASNLCDSTRVLILKVNNSPRLEETITICKGETYYGFVESGVYTLRFPSLISCDTVKTIFLTVTDLVLENIETTNTTCTENNGVIKFSFIDNLENYELLLNNQSVEVNNNKIENLEANSYILTFIDSQNCKYDFQIEIKVTDCNIYVPNAFTPDGDGVNDVFKIFSKSGSNIIVNKLFIWNRWGEAVYVKNNFSILDDIVEWWDGTYKGNYLGNGVYVYYLEIDFDGKKEHFKGSVSIIR